MLYPSGAGRAPASSEGLAQRSTVDLDLDTTIAALCDQPDQRETVSRILLGLCQDADTIRYRQEVLADLLDDRELAAAMERLLPDLCHLTRYHLPRDKAELLYEVTWRLGELESYCDCIDRLAEIMDASRPNMRSRALRRLRAYLRAVRDDPVFESLREELPSLMSRVRGIASVTVGINLDRDLQPQAATLLQINKRRFRGSSDSLLGRLFGAARSEEGEGIAPLHTMPRPGGGEEHSPQPRPIMVPLFRDLSDVLGRSCRPVAAALERYVRVNSRSLAEIGSELRFYLGALHLIRRVRGWGLPMCRPEIEANEWGICRLREGYNLNLALRFAGHGAAGLGRRIVRNDIEIGTAGRVFVLTGPNRGGKTTYMQAVGLAQVLAQAGLYVPASEARISPVDGIFTHFPAREHPELDTGRLGEEAGRLRELFSAATPGSLILLNESLSATSPGESLELAREVLAVLRLLGARSIYTTHLHELALEAERLNRESPGSAGMASLVSVAEEGGTVEAEGGDEPVPTVRRTFKIRPGTPAGRSYAREIAEKHGVSYRRLEELLRKRGVLP